MLFFFQAEDGIRDIGVTGVQTCALPISRHRLARLARGAAEVRGQDHVREIEQLGGDVGLLGEDRSGERRVGKECRSRWAPHHLKKKKIDKSGTSSTARIRKSPTP